MNTSALIIMAKEPKIGSTKTRLCPPLKLEEAARFYEAMLRDTIDMAASLDDIALAIAVTPPESTSYFEEIAPADTFLVPVECDSIGQCLSSVSSHLLEMGFSKVIALNSDGPSLPTEYILQGFLHLDDHDLVFGPSEDGGYYLVGLKSVPEQIFTGIKWSTSRVLRQTLEKCRDLNLNAALLPGWYDVDTAADIERLRGELNSLPKHVLTYTRSVLNLMSGKSG